MGNSVISGWYIPDLHVYPVLLIKSRGKAEYLNLSAVGSDRKYHKELLFPSQVAPEALSRSHKNGIFEARFKKK